MADLPAQPSETERVYEYEARVAASPETVFDFFTDPAKMVQWMGTEASLDPRPGGVCRINPSGHSVMSGEFVEVDPPRRIVFTWGWEMEMFGAPPKSTIVEVSLTPDGEETVLRLTHRRLLPQSLGFHRAGWEHYLARLERVAARADPGPDPWRDLETATQAMRAAAGLI